ncbi:MAG: amidohydrolase family protein [Dehalococcoidia bacterium]|nr:amidohydrolase family protein [Dehalococcoidia bacterium]
MERGYFMTGSVAKGQGARYQLMKVALGEAEADLAIVNGSIVNVYTAEVLNGSSVLIKGDKIAFVGKDTGRAIGSSTRVIDAAGKILIPGLIDGHTHIDNVYTVSELLRYAIKGGTTTIITETSNIASVLGYEGIIQFLASIKNQPIKIFVTAAPMVTLSPVTEKHAVTVDQLRKLLRRKEIIGLGEPYWGQVVNGNRRILDLITETIRLGKKVDGHSSGARDNKLQAYISSGVSSCHEPITVEEVMERLRLGLFVLIREGEIRRELEAIARIRDENIDFTRLAISTDGIGPWQLVSDGYMEFVVQKAIDLGFSPILAIQMATINVAQHFALDDFIGGIAPGKYADIAIIPDPRTIRAEYVISNGQVIVQDGQPLVLPRKHNYPKSIQNSMRLARNFEASDFAIPVESNRRQVRVRVIDQVTNLVTRESFIDMPVSDGQLKPDASKGILKVAAIERFHRPSKTFVGFIRGIGLKHGAIATSAAWDCGDIIVVGASEADMAQAVNRVIEMVGGIVVCASSKILAEVSLPVAGLLSTQPMEAIADKLYDIQQAATSLGCALPDIRITLAVLATPAIAHLRICESGLFNLRQNEFVSLIVD